MDASRRKASIPEWAAACAVTFVGLALVWLLMSVTGGFQSDHPAVARQDHMVYLAMTRDGPGAPGPASTPPYCWRILVPMLARWSPMPPADSYLAIVVVSLAGTALCLYALCRRAGLPHAGGLAGIGLFLTIFWAVGLSLWNPLLVDAPILVLTAAGLVVLEHPGWPPARRRILVAAIMVLGALTKESILALTACVVLHEWRTDRSSIPRRVMVCAAVAAPALTALVVVRMAIQADPGLMPEFENYSLWTVFSVMVWNRLADLPRWAIEALVDPWGPLVIVPLLVSAGRAWKWCAAFPHRMALVLVAFSQTLVATSVGRLVVIACPVICLFAAEELWRRSRRAAHPALMVSTLLVLQFVFQYARRTTFGLGLPPYEPHPWVTAAYVGRAMIFVAVLVWWLSAARSPDHDPDLIQASALVGPERGER